MAIITVTGRLGGSSRCGGGSRGGGLGGSRGSGGLLRNSGSRRLRGHRGVASRIVGVALQSRLIPSPTTVTCRWRLLGRRGLRDTASLTRVPAPAVSGTLSVLRRDRRAGRGSASNAAVTLREAARAISE